MSHAKHLRNLNQLSNDLIGDINSQEEAGQVVSLYDMRLMDVITRVDTLIGSSRLHELYKVLEENFPEYYNTKRESVIACKN